MTLTLKKAVRTISCVRRLEVVNRCASFLRNPSSGSNSGHEITNGRTDEHRWYNILRSLRTYRARKNALLGVEWLRGKIGEVKAVSQLWNDTQEERR